MKKLVFGMLILISSGFLFAQKQKPEFNRWSIDINAGLNKTVRNFAPGYSSGLADFGELNVGARYMFNAYVGLKLGLVFDRFNGGNDSPDFATNMGRLSLDGIVNVGNALNFYQWTDRLGLLFHAGIGVGNFVDQGFPLFSSTIDKVGSVTFGLTPQIKLNDKWSLNLDASIVGLARMHHSFDYTSNGTFKNVTSRGFNGQFFTGTVGVSYYLGKKESHADWSPTKSVSKSELDSLKADMTRMRNGLNDDDKDGVPNYLDQEANSPEGATVNSRGVVDPTTTDTDKDGIADAYDMCPDEKGKFSANGCPDADGDGVADKDDKCPDVAGSMWNNGCPGGSGGDNVISVNPPIENLYFSIASATLSRKETAKLDKVVDLMKANPSYKLVVKGHTDNMGAFDYNQSLSENRAIAAKNYLLKKGVDPMRVQTVAYGFNQPVGKENTTTGRSLNRRVEFEVRN